jgi:predicted amidohydrolase YtcJ
MQSSIDFHPLMEVGVYSKIRVLILVLLLAPWSLSRGFAQSAADAEALVSKNGHADMILVNGKIVSMDDVSIASTPGKIYQAMAIKNQRVMALGTNDFVRQLASSSTQVLDVKGRTVIPALVEPHSHIYDAALREFGDQMKIKLPNPGVNLGYLTVGPDQTAASFKQQILSRLQEGTKQVKPGEWLVLGARGTSKEGSIMDWSGEPWSGKLPTRPDMDKVTPNNPVLLQTGVRSFINSKGMQEANKFFPGYEEFLDLEGRKGAASYGWIQAPEISTLSWEIWMRDVPLSTIAEMFYKEMEHWSAFGVGTVATRIPHPTLISGFNWLHRTQGDKMPIRFGMWFETQRTPTIPEAAATLFKRTGSFWPYGDDHLWFMGMASELWDGIGLQACPGPDLEAPKAIKDQEVCPDPHNIFWQVYQNAIEAGWRPGGAHGSGSHGIRTFIEMLETAMKNKGFTAEYIRSIRPTMEHCEIIGMVPDVVAKLKEYGFILSCGPRYLSDEELYLRSYGPQADKFILPLHSLIQSGIRVVGQLDTNPNVEGVFFHLWLAITRNWNGKVYQPSEKVDRVTALKMWTRWAAEYVYKEKDIGSLESGKLADFTVLDRDYFTIPEDDIKQIRPSITAIGGAIQYVDGKVAADFGLKPVGFQQPPEFPFTQRGMNQ